jgi:hypothetical protein
MRCIDMRKPEKTKKTENTRKLRNRKKQKELGNAANSCEL